MKSTTIVCDICGETIGKDPIGGYHGRMIEWVDPYQVWPSTSGEHDVCPKCCGILAKARARGLITFDLEPLLIGGGFEKQDDGDWRRGGMFQERFVMPSKQTVEE
jgi:hypothetical protein